MIIYNNIKYATSDKELIDSLFEDGGTLEPLFKIKKRKNDILFFKDADSGFGINRFGVPFKFRRLENKKLCFFHTLDEDKESFRKYFEQLTF